LSWIGYLLNDLNALWVIGINTSQKYILCNNNGGQRVYFYRDMGYRGVELVNTRSIIVIKIHTLVYTLLLNLQVYAQNKNLLL